MRNVLIKLVRSGLRTCLSQDDASDRERSKTRNYNADSSPIDDDGLADEFYFVVQACSITCAELPRRFSATIPFVALSEG
jgi:hypothetical protein